MPMTDDQIKYMVNRFLSWKLPESFNPDGGVSFKKMFNEHTAYPMKHEPSGTNLFDATQTDAMVRHMIEGIPCEVAERTADCGELTHTRSCHSLGGAESDCTCSLKWRVALATEQSMHQAWRKRAEEAEKLKTDRDRCMIEGMP